MKRRLLAACCLLLLGCELRPKGVSSPTPAPPLSPTPALVARPKAEWTVLLYLAGDNDGEEAQLQLLEALCHGLASDPPTVPRLRLLALLDRSPLGEPSAGYTHRAVVNQPNWSGARLLEVEHDRLTTLEDWGPVNMADPDTLSRALDTTRRIFPSNHLGLILSGEGRGWNGLASDESSGSAEDTFTLKEMDSSLKDSEPLDLLLLNASAMASLEVFDALAPHARWLLASPGVISNQAQPLARVLRGLQERPAENGAVVGHQLLAVQPPDPDASLSLLDGRARPRLLAGWRRLVGSGPWAPERRGRGADSFTLDAADLGPRGCAWARIAVKERVAGPLVAAQSGLRVYAPSRAAELGTDYGSAVSTSLNFWVEALRAGRKLQLPRPTVHLGALVARGNRLRCRLLHPERVSSCWVTLARHGVEVGRWPVQPDRSGELSASWTGRWPSLGGSPLRVDWISGPLGAKPRRARSRAQWNPDGEESHWVDVDAWLALTSSGGRLLDATRPVSPSLVPVPLRDGGKMRLRLLDLDTRNDGRLGPEWTVTAGGGRTLEEKPLPDGSYSLGFCVADNEGREQRRSRDVRQGR